MKEITPSQYQEGIFDICDSLVSDLLKFLKDEGRYKFRMIGYMRKITEALESVYSSKTEEEIEICERVIYLGSKSIIKDYHRLRSRKMSPADSLICILLKLISISESISGEFKYKVQQDKIKGVLQGFYENIKNKAKLDKLCKIESSLLESISERRWGKLRMKELNMYLIEHPTEKSQEIQGEKETWGISGKEIEL